MATSQENQAKLNNAQWLANYRQMASQINPEMSPVDLSQNINVALRDPRNGQATATGLATGQALLNSWIAGANAKARKQATELSNERWIKQQKDAAEDKAYQRKWNEAERQHQRGREALQDKRYNETLKHQREREAIQDRRYDEALQEYVPDTEPMVVSPFITDPRQKALAQLVVDTNNKDLKGGVARNAVEAGEIRERQAQARKRTEQYLAKLQTQVGFTPEQTEQLNASDVGDVRHNNWFTRHFPWRSDFETDLARQTGSDKYVNYDNFAQLRNAYSSVKNFEAARWLGEMERQILMNGDRILQIVRPGNENAPTHVLTNHGSYILDPIRMEMRPVQAEVK